MRRHLSAGLSALGLVVLVSSASAQDHAWQIRTRGLLIAPIASSTPTGLDVKANAVAEVDITRFVGRNFAFELVLGTSSQEVTATSGNTTTSLGMVSHLPPTLTFQYRPVPTGSFQPYLGAGGNLTYFYAKSGDLEGLDLTTSIGYALQGGADFAIGGNAYFNLDVKYVNIQTDVKSGSTKAYDLKINPLLIGLGFGIRL
ncbi:MAG: OmpW family outer membrane protein [Gemmatimonadales bacterium]